MSGSFYDVRLPSDYPSAVGRAVLRIVADGQGDYHITLQPADDSDDGRAVRIAASGTHYSVQVRLAFAALVNAVEADLDAGRDRLLLEVNGRTGKRG